MATRRVKSATMRFGVPLPVPGSRYVEVYYGKHGKAYAQTPLRHSDIELVLMNVRPQRRAVACVRGLRLHRVHRRDAAVAHGRRADRRVRPIPDGRMALVGHGHKRFRHDAGAHAAG
jgi:hypothetical protein